MAVLCSMRHKSSAGNKESKLSIACWQHLEAPVQLDRFRGRVHRRDTFGRHLWSGGRCNLWTRLSESQCNWVRCVEVHSVDLGHAGGQVAEETSPHLCVHPFTCGEETESLRLHASGSCESSPSSIILSNGRAGHVAPLLSLSTWSELCGPRMLSPPPSHHRHVGSEMTILVFKYCDGFPFNCWYENISGQEGTDRGDHLNISPSAPLALRSFSSL
ncbi:hypothetical protein EYF80_019943 [Liparis tanakae]|uniref:Uncharacterized protein n=1 Tax=Liparis tanakae TaxID=230148 RepID=A0A4Z2HX14_9TELE|nr:hypothetical protein EYF80_019943 [Liparis tanakae]